MAEQGLPARLGDCVALWQRLGGDAFKRCLTTSVLVQQASDDEDDSEMFSTADGRRHTPVFCWPAGLTQFEAGTEWNGDAAVFALRKTIAEYQNMVSVGRAPNVDISITERTISKFHAYFEEIDGAWTLSDAGSRNGTTIGPRAVAKYGKVALKNLDIIQFGLHVRFRYFTAAGFCEFMAALAAQPPR
jgi:hypothetical protein